VIDDNYSTYGPSRQIVGQNGVVAWPETGHLGRPTYSFEFISEEDE